MCVCECELDATGVALSQTCVCVCECENVNLKLPCVCECELDATGVSECELDATGVAECELDATGVAQYGNQQAQYAARFEKGVACVCVCEMILSVFDAPSFLKSTPYAQLLLCCSCGNVSINSRCSVSSTSRL